MAQGFTTEDDSLRSVNPRLGPGSPRRPSITTPERRCSNLLAAREEAGDHIANAHRRVPLLGCRYRSVRNVVEVRDGGAGRFGNGLRGPILETYAGVAEALQQHIQRGARRDDEGDRVSHRFRDHAG